MLKWNWHLFPTIVAKRPTYFTLNYFLGGHAVYVVDGTRHDLGKGDVLFIRAGARKEIHGDPSAAGFGYSIHFEIPAAEEWPTALELPTVFPIGVDPEITEYLERIETEWLTQSPAAPMIVCGTTMALIGLLADRYADPDYQRGSRTRHFARIRKLILEHYDEPLTTEDIATAIGLNPVYLGNYFRKTTGMTIREYTNRIRVRKARGLLLSGNYSVASVAKRCGFGDPFYFSKVFKRIAGVAPSELKP